jgi:ATP-dependent exoDNAse (exonuclease V) beta subunit
MEQAGELDPLDLGRLVHAALERVDFRGPLPPTPWCEQLAEALVIPEAARAAALASDLLSQFVASLRWQRLADANALYREVEFLLAWPPGDANGDGRYLQGYVDALYRDAAGWHLVDYKTNDVAADAVPRVAAQYEMQMLVYALAAERALGEAPVELALHFLRPGVEHVFPWNDAARRRGIELVNAALAAS